MVYVPENGCEDKSIHLLCLYTNYNVFLKKIQGYVLTFLKRSVIVTVEMICIQLKKRIQIAHEEYPLQIINHHSCAGTINKTISYWKRKVIKDEIRIYWYR